MTRTRTQTALTKMAELVANIHGELEFIEKLISGRSEHQAALEVRQRKLQADRDALYQTLKQFDPDLEPTQIGVSEGWLKTYGKRGTKPALRRYLSELENNSK